MKKNFLSEIFATAFSHSLGRELPSGALTPNHTIGSKADLVFNR